MTVQTVVLVATALAALANWWSRWRDDDPLERWTKPLTTLLVIAVAVVSGAPGDHVAIAVVALTLCLAGDVFLLPAVDRFVPGLASFLLGHVVFIVLFLQYGLDSIALAGAALSLALVLDITVGVVIVRTAAAHDGGLRMPVAAYLTVISAMAVVGWSTGNPWVVAGTALFVVSDSVLGWRQFVRPAGWMGPVVMVTYHGAITALALSLW